MSTVSSYGLPDSNLKVHAIHVAPRIPLEANYLLLNIRSKSQIVPRKNQSIKYPPATTPLVVVSRAEPPSTTL
jgi:hypothetical protein